MRTDYSASCLRPQPAHSYRTDDRTTAQLCVSKGHFEPDSRSDALRCVRQVVIHSVTAGGKMRLRFNAGALYVCGQSCSHRTAEREREREPPLSPGDLALQRPCIHGETCGHHRSVPAHVARCHCIGSGSGRDLNSPLLLDSSWTENNSH